LALWFDDSAAALPGRARRARPAHALRSFDGAAAAGPWRLEVRDRDRNGLQGALLGWGVRVVTAPCQRVARWTRSRRADDAVAPPPRVDASSVAIGSAWFVWAGRGRDLLRDLWRFDAGAWTQLRTEVALQPRPAGRVGTLTPWGVVAWAATGASTRASEPALALHTVWDDRWRAVNGTDAHAPAPRASPALALVGVAGSDSRLRGVDAPQLVLWGGATAAGPSGELWALPLQESLEDAVRVPWDSAATDELRAHPRLRAWVGRDAGAGVGAADGAGAVAASGVRAPVLDDLEGASAEARALARRTWVVADAGAAEPPGGWQAEARWRAVCPALLADRGAAALHWQLHCAQQPSAQSPQCTPSEVLVRAWCVRAYGAVGAA
jgi:hypothetical protein